MPNLVDVEYERTGESTSVNPFGMREMQERAYEALKRVGLEDRIEHTPSELSGGQQQRVAVARALVTSPSIILADEPTGNLDSKTSAEIMMLFENLHNEGNTIILVTHEPELCKYAKRLVRLSDGLVEIDEPVTR